MRTFVAIELPKEIKERLEEFSESLKKSLPLRFVAPQNLHLTLFFLGEVAETRMLEVIEAVRSGVRGIKPFSLHLGKPEFFPKFGRVHGLWVELEGELKVLERLYQQISKELKLRHFQFAPKPLVPHITLGRAKRKMRKEQLSNLAIKQLSRQKFKIASVGVFTSRLTPEGPIYNRQMKIELVYNKAK